MNNEVRDPPSIDVDDVLDEHLIAQALEGSRQALEQLIERHQPFVFNVALRMFGRLDDAKDLTQEVFVKVITSLGSFERRSAFRTWLYRIAVNHFLKAKRRDREKTVADFESFFQALAEIPDEPLDPTLGIDDDTIEDLRLRCTSGMLLCLDREQRLVLILGALFEIPHQIAAAALDITPENFRVRLHRARRDLYSWMNARCGLVNSANPCRCRAKTSAFVRAGLVDPRKRLFLVEHVSQIDSHVRARSTEAMDVVDALHERIFTDQPPISPGKNLAQEILGNETIRTFFALTN